MSHSILVMGATGGIGAWRVTSVAAGSGFRMHAVTGTVKAAVQGLTRSLAAELAPAIRVNRIAPALTRIPLAAAFTKSPTVADGACITEAVMHADGGCGAVAGAPALRFGASSGAQAWA